MGRLLAVIGFFLAMAAFAGTGGAQTTVPNAPLPNGRMPNAASPTVPVAAPPAARIPQPASVPPQLLSSTETVIDQQTRGQFPVMDRAPSLPLGTLQRSWDRPSPASGQAAPGVIHYMWHPDFVMGVRTRDFMVTTVILPNWEKANEHYVGDPVVFETKKIRANVIAIRSRNAGADSNLTILGASGNVYNFYIRSETWNSSQVSDLTVYVDAPRNVDEPESSGPSSIVEADARPADGGPYGAAIGMPDYLRKVVFRPEELRFDMKMFAKRDTDAEIAPERVFEDGIFTYFDFGEQSDSISRPVVHHLVDGVDTVVNTRTVGPRGSILIAEAVGDFTLRNGNRVVCVRQLDPRRSPYGVEIGSTLPEPATTNSSVSKVAKSTSGKEK